jgi:hypothetical protein
LYRHLKKLENGSKIFTLDYVNMAGVRERGALPAGCGRPLVWWYDLGVWCVGVCMGVEREPGEKERRERGGLKRKKK